MSSDDRNKIILRQRVKTYIGKTDTRFPVLATAAAILATAYLELAGTTAQDAIIKHGLIAMIGFIVYVWGTHAVVDQLRLRKGAEILKGTLIAIAAFTVIGYFAWKSTIIENSTSAARPATIQIKPR